MGNELFLELLEAENHLCAQPLELRLDGPRQSQGKCFTKGWRISFSYVHPCLVGLEVGDWIRFPIVQGNRWHLEVLQGDGCGNVGREGRLCL